MALNSALVKDGWIIGFAREPGRNADYRAGRSLRWGACCHQTAGRCAGDRSILTNLGGAYVPRDPGCGPGATMFSQLDAVAFTQCEWNDELMPCEVEWLPGQSFTAYQIDRCGLFVAACISVGVPDARLDPPVRVLIGTRIGGFIDHRKLQHRACDEHGDGWYAHWPAIRKAADKYLGDGAEPWREPEMYYIDVKDGPLKGKTFAVDGAGKRPCSDAEADLGQVVGGAKRGAISGVQAATIRDAPTGASLPGTGATKAEVDASIAAALAPFRSLLPGV